MEHLPVDVDQAEATEAEIGVDHIHQGKLGGGHRVVIGDGGCQGGGQGGDGPQPRAEPRYAPVAAGRCHQPPVQSRLQAADH